MRSSAQGSIVKWRNKVIDAPPDVVRRKSPPWCLTPWTYQVSRGTGSSINLLPRVECGTWRCRLTQPPSFSGFETFAAENAENDLFSLRCRNLSAGYVGIYLPGTSEFFRRVLLPMLRIRTQNLSFSALYSSRSRDPLLGEKAPLWAPPCSLTLSGRL